MLPGSFTNIGSASATAVGTLIPKNIAGGGLIDTSQTDWLAVQFGGTWAGSIVAEGTFDLGTTFSQQSILAELGGAVLGSITGNGIYLIHTPAPQTRLRVGTYTSGTVQLIGGTTDIGNAPVTNPAAAATPTQPVTNTPASGTAFTYVSTASTNPAAVKASAGTLYEIDVTNTSASTVYLKLYDKPSGLVVGTDVPVLILPVSAGSSIVQSFASLGKRFGSGISFALTGAQAVADTTAISAGVLVSGVYL